MLTDKEYAGDLDLTFFEAHDVEVIKHQPWQFSLLHPDLKGKYVWYPKKGTLMFESAMAPGMATRYKVGEHTDPEKVYAIMQAKINQQQNGE